MQNRYERLQTAMQRMNCDEDRLCTALILREYDDTYCVLGLTIGEKKLSAIKDMILTLSNTAYNTACLPQAITYAGTDMGLFGTSWLADVTFFKHPLSTDRIIPCDMKTLENIRGDYARLTISTATSLWKRFTDLKVDIYKYCCSIYPETFMEINGKALKWMLSPEDIEKILHHGADNNLTP